jgi:hypothetical protein
MNSRRKFLKASLAGSAALAINPYLNAAPSKAGTPPKRFIFIRKSNGTSNTRFTLPNLPANLVAKEKKLEPFNVSLDKYELPDLLKGMNEYKEHMTIVQGMTHKMTELAHWSFQGPMGLFVSKKNSISALKRATIDYELAKLFPSPLGHIELSFGQDRKGIVSGYSCPAPNTRNFAYADAITAYNNLFKCVLNPDLLKSENSKLGYLADEVSSMASGLDSSLIGGHEKYVQAMRSVSERNNNLTKMASQIAKKLPDRKRIMELGKITNPIFQRQEAMTEVLISAFTSGMTNVATYTIDDLDTIHFGVPGIESQNIHLHGIGHNKSFGGFSPTKIRKIILEQHMKQIKKIVEGLKAEPEGSGNMFDNTTIVYFPEAGEKHHGQGHPPFFIMSGKNCNLDIAGRYFRFPAHGLKGHQTLGNFYTTLLNSHGNPISHYGDLDSTMARKKLKQTGPIKSFLKA